MSPSGPLVTIVVVPRERFSHTRISLRSILATTTEPHELVYVDGGSPSRTADWLRRASETHGFELIRSDRYLSPNQARNIGLARVRTRYACFIDNDVIVSPRWLEHLVRCAEETDAWIVGPLYVAGLGRRGERSQHIHMAGGTAELRTETGVRILATNHGARNRPIAEVDRYARQSCDYVEFHAMLVRTDAFERTGPLDEELLSRHEYVDFGLRVKAAGGTCYNEPASRVTYISGPPFRLDDLPFYFLRWSPEWNRRSMARLAETWPTDGHLTPRETSNLRSRRRRPLEPLKTGLRAVGGRAGEALWRGVGRCVEEILIPIGRRRWSEPRRQPPPPLANAAAGPA